MLLVSNPTLGNMSTCEILNDPLVYPGASNLLKHPELVWTCNKILLWIFGKYYITMYIAVRKVHGDYERKNSPSENDQYIIWQVVKDRFQIADNIAEQLKRVSRKPKAIFN